MMAVNKTSVIEGICVLCISLYVTGYANRQPPQNFYIFSTVLRERSVWNTIKFQADSSVPETKKSKKDGVIKA